jgi:D-alanyl-D-alanine carboxypeptidase
MKKILTIGTVVLILTGCTSVSEEHEQKPETSTSETTTSSEPLSAEEQAYLSLLEDLPEGADPHDGNLLLVNKDEKMPEDLEVPLTEIEPEHYVHENIVASLEEWLQSGREAGHDIYFGSGYRSVEHQEFNYNWNVENYMSQGMNEEEAQLKTEEYIAPPGSSEHHTGLAVDLLDEQWVAEGGGYSEEFDQRPSQHWLKDTMQDYGFILRYPQGKEEVTGYGYEPWHFRYVGEENAQFIDEHELTLEEYLELLEEREMLRQ